MRHLSVGALALGIGLTLSSGALAQTRGADVGKEWKVKFDAGREALRAGRAKDALALFQESWALNKTAGTMLNIGTCEEKLGLFASARKHYEEALGLLPAKDDRVPTVKGWVTGLEVHVPRLRIQLDKAAPAGTKVTVGGDEVEAGALDKEMPLDPGKYSVVVSASGFVKRTYDVVLEDGEKETLVVSPGAREVEGPVVIPAPGAGAREGAGPAQAAFPLRTGVIAGGGALAGAAIVTGAVLAGLSASAGERAATVRGRLAAGQCAAAAGAGASADCVELRSVLSEQNTLGSASAWAFGGGGVVGLATVGYWYLVSKMRSPAVPSVRPAAMVSADGGWFVLQGKW